MVAPLKLNGTSGDLKEMTTAEEYYLAYQAGLQLAAMTNTDIAALDNTVGGTTIGSYSNTFYNQAVGTHPGSSLTIGTTTTTVYQNTGTASETGVTRPIRFTTAGSRIDEFNDTNYNEIADRLLPIIMVNEYPGTYRLGSTSPGAAWDTHIASIFSDTRADGASVVYNIYQRQSITSPTAIRPIKLDDASGNLQEMTDAEIKLTFGQRVKTRIMAAANGIGAYQLRSSAAGAPVATGTWSARGTATDTRNTTSEIAYSANYTAGYDGTYSANYTAGYDGTYSANRATDFSANYQRNRTANRATNFVGNYTNPNAINYQRTRVVGFIRTFSGQDQYYVAYYLGDYLGPQSFTGNYIGDFIGDFLGDYVGNYIGDFIGNYTGTYIGDYIGNYTGTYIGDYIGNYTGTTLGAGTATVETYTLYVRTA
jgi:hypothetical protein